MGSGTFSSVNTTLQDANVNSGVAVNMNAYQCVEMWEVYSSAPGVVFTDTTAAIASRLTPGKYVGFGNPTFTLTGKMYIGEDAANTISPATMRLFCASNATKVLVDNLAGTINVVITGFQATHDNSEDTKGLVEYSLKLLRVQ